jgi:hypothetical protein
VTGLLIIAASFSIAMVACATVLIWAIRHWGD